jgi:hypothetical protein
MSEDAAGAVVAGVICLGCWAVLAAPLAFAAHARMAKVEREDRKRALPANETPLILYGVAAIAWPMALGVAIVGLAKREWSRLGRNGAFILIGHFTVYVIGSVFISANTASTPEDSLLAIVGFAASIVAVGTLGASLFAWLWSGARAARIASAPATKEGMGALRFAIYAVSLFFWPAGIVCVAIMNEPHDAHVGKVAFRMSLLNLVLIALATCAAVPFVATYL